MATNHAEAHDDTYHITPFPTYIKVYAALVVFTILTVGLAQLNLSPKWIGVTIAMAIATAKAMMVVWYFMHQGHEGKMNRAIFASGFVFLFIFFGFCYIDWATRKNMTEVQDFSHGVGSAAGATNESAATSEPPKHQ